MWDTEQQKKHEAEIKDALTQLAGLREIYRILETARLGGTKDTEEEDMIRMEASKPVLSREDYLEIHKYLTDVWNAHLEATKDAVKQGLHDLAHFCAQRADHIEELLDKVVREAGLDELGKD